MYRIGNGYDVHRLKEGIPLRVGGINIPYEFGLEAHSDGDVLIHALCDALLGAAALGDIGQHFPDNSAEFKGIDSRILLTRVCELIREKGFEIGNVDNTIVAQVPKFLPYIISMREELARVMNIEVDRVGLKATTTEKLGFTGRKEGIAAISTVILQKV